MITHVSASFFCYCCSSFSVGLTGGIGCGKSLVADLFAAYGVTVIDTDKISHQLTAPAGVAISVIQATFGTNFINAEGALDRVRMRELVFSDALARKKLEAILHPLIAKETQRQAREATGQYKMLVIPLLIESLNTSLAESPDKSSVDPTKWHHYLSRVLVVDCPETLQIERVMKRNQLDAAQVKAIIATQVSRENRLRAADDVILNDGTLEHLTRQVEQLHAQYCKWMPNQ